MSENERSRLHVPQKPGTTQSGVCATQSTSAGVDALEPEPGNLGVRTSSGDTERRLDRLPPAEIMTLLLRQNFRCALTGQSLNPSNAALDHIRPICRGGSHTIRNMQALLDTVNRAKGTMTQDEFIQLCREVVTWADRSQEGEANGRS
jgi:hypothetical protein